MWADHIHLRCPGNIGLLGCLVQIFFPKKPKTAKYAGNWDPKSKQPLSYKLQKWILSNTFLTRNCKVLVYGKWQNQTKNIIPFFTASYKKNEIEVIPNKDLTKQINLIYVGTFSEGKQPLLSVKITQELVEKGYNVNLNMFGSGQQFEIVQNYIKDKFLEKNIILHGSQSKTLIKDYYKKSHFLLFISKSEGWPKVVAEAMFWQCLPISSNVSCIPYMLNNNKRGDLVINGMKISDISAIIINYINNKDLYFKKVKAAKQWSQKITLDKFESEIKKILF